MAYSIAVIRQQSPERGRSRSGRKRGRGGILMLPWTKPALQPLRSSTCSQRRRMWISGRSSMCCGRSPGRLPISPSSATGNGSISCTCRSSVRVGLRFGDTIGSWKCANPQQPKVPRCTKRPAESHSSGSIFIATDTFNMCHPSSCG